MVLLPVFCLSCTAVPTMPDLAAGLRPVSDSDEAGLWMQMERVEAEFHGSGRIVKDRPLGAYVRQIICRLASQHCAGIRVDIVEVPDFNAAMAPNGWLQVWTGLLLRVENEAQLAYVLGHELAHYLRRHSLQRWRNARSATDLATFTQTFMIGAGRNDAAAQTSQALWLSLYAFSQDNELEADALGLDLMANAGYDPAEAASVWEALIEEHRAAQPDAVLPFALTHPSTKERIRHLREVAAARTGSPRSVDRGAERLARAIASFRMQWLRDEFSRRDYGRLFVLLNRLARSSERLGEISFYQGELYRLRESSGDEQRAINAYRQALDLPGSPPEAMRALGLLYWKTGDKLGARDLLTRYLKTYPGADDREMIRSYLHQLE